MPICTKVPIESESEIVDMYVEVVQRNRSIRAAVIDHISSQSAIQERRKLRDSHLLFRADLFLVRVARRNSNQAR